VGPDRDIRIVGNEERRGLVVADDRYAIDARLAKASRRLPRRPAVVDAPALDEPRPRRVPAGLLDAHLDGLQVLQEQHSGERQS
jgi:hypothetical protein